MSSSKKTTSNLTNGYRHRRLGSDGMVSANPDNTNKPRGL
jgi:hypothetical protein